MSGRTLMPADSDRLLILAPHPDDESIATGGLIQIARSAGAAVRVFVLTDGDNNPWPQRWIEKRWRIDVRARTRWGARRGEEARAAMRLLGLGADDARFLGLPDLGLTDLLMSNDQPVLQALRAGIDEFKPNVLVLPALSDRHPDHSATHVLARGAIVGAASPPRLYAFAVHAVAGIFADTTVTLTPAQRELKRAAILAHETQMRLSRRRFLRYAASNEEFFSVGDAIEEDLQHPLRAHMDAAGQLQVSVDLRRWDGPWRDRVLFVALADGSRIMQPLHDIAHRQRGEIHARVQCPKAAGGYVKLARAKPGWRVFDRFGWQGIVQT
jgi:LmbE family N-acetylglucosaminyl deacetylase